MLRQRHGLVLLVLLSAALPILYPFHLRAQGTFHVQFDQGSYVIGLGETVPVHVVINPIPVDGVFSFGVRVVLPGSGVVLDGTSPVRVTPELDYGGPLGPGALTAVGPGTVAVKGTVDPNQFPPVPFSGSRLLTVYLKGDALTGQTAQDVTLELYRTLGDSESVFVTGGGETLDNQMTFGRAIISVVPEPSTTVLACLGLVGMFTRWATGGGRR